MRCYVGVDGGGSKTTVAVAEAVAGEAGPIIGRATTGPSNYQALGIDLASRTVASAIAEAVQAAGAAGTSAEPAEIVGLCLALAGVARPEDDLAWRSAVQQWISDPAPHLRWSVRAAGAVITHDAMAALVGGTGKREGVVVIAGTGSIAFGVNDRGEQHRSGGWGYLLGDEGSGYSIGLAGLRAVCRAADRRDPPTSLTRALLAALHLTSPSALVRPMYSEWKPVDVAALAPIVLDAASSGDAASCAIVDGAAHELARAALSVLHALDLTHHATDVVTAGGLWDGPPLLRERFSARVLERAPNAAVISPRAAPVVGAIRLARSAT